MNLPILVVVHKITWELRLNATLAKTSVTYRVDQVLRSTPTCAARRSSLPFLGGTLIELACVMPAVPNIYRFWHELGTDPPRYCHPRKGLCTYHFFLGLMRFLFEVGASALSSCEEQSPPPSCVGRCCRFCFSSNCSCRTGLSPSEEDGGDNRLLLPLALFPNTIIINRVDTKITIFVAVP